MSGTVVIAFVLAFSRWGTNIGVAPLFISDVLIALALFHAFVSAGFRRSRPVTVANAIGVTPLFYALSIYVVARLMLSLGQGSLLDWLRDGVPFLYGILAFLSAYSLARNGVENRNYTFRVLRVALTLHLLWSAVISFSGLSSGFDVLGPLSQAPVFEIRPDIDAALISVAGALYLRELVWGRRRVWNAIGLTIAILTVTTTMSTRAGLLSLAITLAATYSFAYAASHQIRGRQLGMLFAIPLIVGGGLATLPATDVGQRFIASFAPSAVEREDLGANAAGTQRARELTWTEVVSWTNEEPVRALFGSGFGNNFLEQSGTLAYLEGTSYTGVRSPHNWFVGVYARLGLIGLTMVGAWIMQLVFLLWHHRVTIGGQDLPSLSAAIILAILPVASVGVVLEAPFGAIPFFWATGILMGLRGRQTAADELPAASDRLFPRSIIRSRL